MNRSFILSAARSAVVPRGGRFSHLSLQELAKPVLLDCLVRSGVGAGDVDEIIVGNALGAGGNPARLISLAAGFGEHVAGMTIDRQCCSGLDAIILADAMIRSGQARIVVAGGVESYSRRPLRAQTFPDGRPPAPYDQPPFTPWPERDPDMAVAAAHLANELGISREEQDAWAVTSHQKALASRARLTEEIVPIETVEKDTFTRNLTQKTCARATPIAGSITAANTSVAADAAAFCVVTSQDVAGSVQCDSVEVVAGRTVGGQPDRPGITPVAAIQQVLLDEGLSPGDIDVVEVMEAFAAQAIACVSQSGLQSERTNLGGGSLARGHPIGASGAINAVRLYHELLRSGGNGIAAIAAAGGLGTALLLRA
ncbi:thiolase family protein [Sedimentitalea todarodis]|uniref:Thiolase family protein n=1 Tax=Sedimentitalea todarodis TaxID=1631240 RepID=A0ABU3VKK6_9RHOB|nr:thiolase family protein [Sedimentitalea todarodis]MDU9006691.1 thiolase family protein [Sedimentitalea todarodis]